LEKIICVVTVLKSYQFYEVLSLQNIQSISKAFKFFHSKSLFEKLVQIVLFIWILSIPMKNAIYQISTIGFVLLFFIHFIYYKNFISVKQIINLYKIPFVLFGLFLLSMIISSLFGISPKDFYSEISKYFIRYIIIFLALLYFYKESFFSRYTLLAFILIALSIHSLDGLYQYLTGFDLLKHKIPDAPTYLLTGAVYQHNPFGLFMAIGSALSLILISDKKHYIFWKYEKLLYSFLLLLFLFTLFHSQSRAAWVMFGTFSFFYLFLYIKENGIDKRLLFAFILLGIFITLLFILDTNLLQRLKLLLEGNSSSRMSVIWPFTIEKIKEAPLFGYGISTYKLFPEHCCNGVHNLSLELFLYTGIIGFSIMYSLIIFTFIEGIKKSRVLYSLLFLSYILLLQFDGSLISSKIHITIFILLLFFIYSSKKNSLKFQHKVRDF